MKHFLVISAFALMAVACSSKGTKNSVAVKKDASSPAVDIDDALLGTWDQTGVSCSKGEMTSEGKEVATAFRSGMSVAKIVVTSDKVFWDMKEYKDVENPNDFCQVSVEEKWATQAPNRLIVSDSDTLVTGNGQVVCDKKYRYTDVRHHTYKATEKDLSIELSSAHEAMTGVSTVSKPLCKEGEVVLSFQRDSADE